MCSHTMTFLCYTNLIEHLVNMPARSPLALTTAKPLSVECYMCKCRPQCMAKTVPKSKVFSVTCLVPEHRASLTQGWLILSLYYIFISIENIEIYKYIGFYL